MEGGRVRGGTRFRVFPKPEEGWREPELIELRMPPGSIGPGPSDPRLRAILPVAKAAPYDPPGYGPPYGERCLPPARPDAGGHFDHIAVDDPAFLPAHMYACVRHTLEAWEGYLGRPVRWWHAEARPQLELVARVGWANAQSGLGFIEAGGKVNDDGAMRLFALNFDVVAHETGHAILFSELGAPAVPTAAFLAFHECFSDLVSLVAVLHFPSVVDRLLEQTQGNLYALNMLSRIGELSRTQQIRIADNTVTMAEVAGIRLLPSGAWEDGDGLDRNAHGLAQPLTGAIFDVLVEVFQAGLVARGAVPRRADPRPWTRAAIERDLLSLEAVGRRSLAAFRPAFREALCHARDVVGRAMQAAMRSLRPEAVTFGRVAGCLVRSLARQGEAAVLPDVVDIFRLRGIEPDGGERAQGGAGWRGLPYAERVRRVAAGQGGRCGCGGHAAIVAMGRLVRQGHARHPSRAGEIDPVSQSG